VTDADNKIALVERHMRHLIACDTLCMFSWSDWDRVVGKKSSAIKREFEKQYPALFKAYEDYKDLRLVHYILKNHPEWKKKLPQKIEFPK